MEYLKQNSEKFAHIPKDILTDPRLSLAAKGLYCVIGTFPADSPVSLDSVAQLLQLPPAELDIVWDEMLSFLHLREKEEELKAALAELQAELETKS